MKRIVTLVSVIFVIGSGATAAENVAPCKNSPKVVGECFNVHGRIGLSNGIPIRMWIVGTHRMLAVTTTSQDPNDLWFPAPIEKLLELNDPSFRIFVFGDYEVCPLEKDRPGWMRAVCIESGSHLVAATRDGSIIATTP